MASIATFVHLALLSLLPSIQAAEIIFGSVAFVRTGDRLPLVQESETIVTLTSLGAQQAYSVGSALRSRYISTSQNVTDFSSGTNPLYGISTGEADPNQLFLMAEDTEYSVASSTALMQGLYPPWSSSSTTDRSMFLANGSYLPNPMQGYQYVWTHAPSDTDPSSIWVDGADGCQSFVDEATDYLQSSQVTNIASDTATLYAELSGLFASDVLPTPGFGYSNAFGVYDYLLYLYNHDNLAYDILTNGSLLQPSAFNQSRYLSDQYLWAQYSNGAPFAEAQGNDVSTISGQTFAYAVQNRLYNNIETEAVYEKLSIFFGEFTPMMSFFALAGLPNSSPDFKGLPQYGSAMVFELFQEVDSAPAANASVTYPDPSDLQVRFLFRNGTEGDFTIYPMFDSGNNNMTWASFQASMNNIGTGDVGSWCTACNSWDDTPFCLAYNSSAWNGVKADGHCGSSGLDPKMAGVIGAIATLGVVLGLFLIAVGFGGLRFQRVGKERQNGPAHGQVNFRGGHKLEEGPDMAALTTESKNAQVTVGDRDIGPDGKERPGSWEMGGVAAQGQKPRRSEDDDKWIANQRPVQAEERI